MSTNEINLYLPITIHYGYSLQSVIYVAGEKIEKRPRNVLLVN